jgi:hypothetical protein
MHLWPFPTDILVPRDTGLLNSVWMPVPRLIDPVSAEDGFREPRSSLTDISTRPIRRVKRRGPSDSATGPPLPHVFWAVVGRSDGSCCAGSLVDSDRWHI